MKRGNNKKEKAAHLRKSGYSYGYISEKVGVAKGTLHYWLSDIPYKPNKHTIETIGKARARSGEVKARQKKDSIRKAKEEAIKDLGKLTKRDLFLLGIGLYIGEGTKSHGVTRIINADPRVINLAIRWFKECLGLKNDNFSLRIHVYPDNDIDSSISFWSRRTGIPKIQFYKTQVDNRVNKKRSKRGKLPYGTAHLTVRSSKSVKTGMALFRKVRAYMDIVMDR